MTWFRSIRFRIVAAFVVAAIAMLAAMGFLVSQTQAVSARHAMITEGYLPIANNVDTLSLFQERVDNDIERLVRGTPRPGVGASSSAVIYTDALRDNIEEARIHNETARALTNDSRDQAVLHKVQTQLGLIEDLFAAYEEQSSVAVALLEDGRREEATARLEPLRRDAGRLRDEIETLSRLVQSRVNGLAEEAETQRVRATAVAGLLAALAVAVCGAGITAVLIALRPIGQLTGQVQRLAAGDYSGRLDVRGGDELAVLAAEFNSMVAALQLRDRTLVERAQQLDLLTRYLGSVLDSLEDGLFVWEEGLVTLTNPAARSTWGVRDEAAVPEILEELIAKPGRRELHAPDNSLHEVRVTRFGDAGAIVVSVDVTEQKQSQERLARSERLALIGQMLAQITHEVRNPLNALSLNAELLSDELGALDPDRKTEAWAVLGTVSGEIDRLTAVTGHYLALARRPPARLEPTDLPGLLDDVVRLLAAELAQNDVALTVDKAALGPRLADGNQLRQGLLNVVRNASEAGAHNLSLSLTTERGSVRISLTDDGPGMTEDEVQRASDPFYSTKSQGTGLGLAITRQILEDHGGGLDVRSSPGAGTTIAMVIPDRPVEPTVSVSAEAS